MKEKTLWDYADKIPPLSTQMLLTINVLLVLKLAGELSHIDWKVIIALWVASVAIRIITAFFRQVNDDSATVRQQPHA